MSNRHVQDLLDLCEEQGFRYDYIKDHSAVRIYPKVTGGKPAVLYLAAKDPQAQMNQTADVRRLGVKFPGDDERARQKLKKEQPMREIKVDDYDKAIASGSLTIPPTPPPPDVFAVIRSKLDAIVTFVSEVEALVSTVEKDQEKMQQLKALMRSL